MTGWLDPKAGNDHPSEDADRELKLWEARPRDLAACRILLIISAVALMIFTAPFSMAAGRPERIIWAVGILAWMLLVIGLSWRAMFRVGFSGIGCAVPMLIIYHMILACLIAAGIMQDIVAAGRP